jgi:hypothetical protein
MLLYPQLCQHNFKQFRNCFSGNCIQLKQLDTTSSAKMNEDQNISFDPHFFWKFVLYIANLWRAKTGATLSNFIQKYNYDVCVCSQLPPSFTVTCNSRILPLIHAEENISQESCKKLLRLNESEKSGKILFFFLADFSLYHEEGFGAMAPHCFFDLAEVCHNIRTVTGADWWGTWRWGGTDSFGRWVIKHIVYLDK